MQEKEDAMKKHVKILSLTLALILALSAFGCAPKNNAANTAKTYEDRDIDYPSDIPKLSEDSIQIHYQRKDNSYGGWTLWLWDPEGTDDGKGCGVNAVVVLKFRRQRHEADAFTGQ